MRRRIPDCPNKTLTIAQNGQYYIGHRSIWSRSSGVTRVYNGLARRYLLLIIPSTHRTEDLFRIEREFVPYFCRSIAPVIIVIVMIHSRPYDMKCTPHGVDCFVKSTNFNMPFCQSDIVIPFEIEFDQNN